MKNFLVLFKLLIKNDLRSDKSKKGFKFNHALLAEIVIGVIVVMGMIILSLTAGVYLNGLGLSAEYLGFLFLIAQFIVLIFGTVLLLSVMYFSKDISFLLPLPVKTSTVFWAKFAYVYVRELFFAGSMVLAGGFTFLIAVNASVYSYFILIFAALMVPILPLMLSSILSLPIIFISGYFKSKGPVLAVILTVIFSAVMFLYMYFITSMQVSAGGGGFSLPLETQKTMVDFFNIFIPVGALAKLVLLKDALINSGLFAASYVVLIFLILLVTKFTFKRSMQRQLEESKKKVSAELKYSKNTIVKSIMKKDFKEIMRNPGLAFNCLVSVVLGPLFITVYGLTSFNSEIYSDAATANILFLTIGFLFLTLFPASMNMTALSSITREGKNFYHIKTLPVKYADQLKAKIILAKIFAFIAVITSGIVFLIFAKLDIFISLSIILFALLFADGYVHYLVLLDLENPKLNYESITAALKNSKSSILAMLIALGLLLPLLAGLIIFMTLLYGNIHIMLLWTIIFVPAFSYAVILNLVFRRKLGNSGLRILAQIEP